MAECPHKIQTDADAIGWCQSHNDPNPGRQYLRMLQLGPSQYPHPVGTASIAGLPVLVSVVIKGPNNPLTILKNNQLWGRARPPSAILYVTHPLQTL